MSFQYAARCLIFSHLFIFKINNRTALETGSHRIAQKHLDTFRQKAVSSALLCNAILLSFFPICFSPVLFERANSNSSCFQLTLIGCFDYPFTKSCKFHRGFPIQSFPVRSNSSSFSFFFKLQKKNCLLHLCRFFITFCKISCQTFRFCLIKKNSPLEAASYLKTIVYKTHRRGFIFSSKLSL